MDADCPEFGLPRPHLIDCNCSSFVEASSRAGRRIVTRSRTHGAQRRARLQVSIARVLPRRP
jgi:hypothetical protein